MQGDILADSVVAALPGQQYPTPSDANIIYYVSGAIAKSVLAATKCNDCKEALLNEGALEPLQYESVLLHKADTFLKDIDRGGLMKAK